MNDLELKVLNSIKQLTSEISFPKILLGLSGGPDSVFLFHMLLILKKEKGIDFLAVHLDHEWRDTSSIDANFCKNLCNKNDINIHLAKASELGVNLKESGSKEELGRKLRRYFFNKLAAENNINFISLAHHLNDQQETFFLRLIRGSTLDGLIGMRSKNGIYIRPLLDIPKSEIIKYLNEKGIEYVHDITNESEKYLRNKIRKYIIPSFDKVDERFNKKFSDTLNFLKEENDFLQNLAVGSFNEVFSTLPEKNNLIVGDLNYFCKLHKVLQKRLIIIWLCNANVIFSPSNSLIDEILKFLNSPRGGSHLFYKSWKIIKKKQLFWIEKI